MHFTLKTNPLKRSDLDEFVKLYKPEKRRENWSDEEGKRGKSPKGRWRSFTYDEIIKRDKANLDIFWLKDDSLEDSENLPDPEILAQEIADDLQTALAHFSAIASELRPSYFSGKSEKSPMAAYVIFGQVATDQAFSSAN